MTFLGLALRSVRHDWRSALGVLAGVAVAAAVLVGALAVGDSVRATLAQRAIERVGAVRFAMATGDRFVRDDLAERLADAAGPDTLVATALQLPGFVTGDAENAVVEVYGIDAGFRAATLGTTAAAEAPSPGEAWVSQALAAQLRGGVGRGTPLRYANREWLLRIEKPSALARDTALSTIDDLSFAIRVRVGRVLSDREIGGFALTASGRPAANVFVSRTWLQEQVELAGRSNLVVVAGAPSVASDELHGVLQDGLHQALSLDDLQMEVAPIGDGRVELRTSRVFLDEVLVDTLAGALGEMPRAADATRVFSWFVNGLVAGDRSTPYSTVTAVGPLLADGEPSELASLTAGLADDRLVPSPWLVNDLGLSVGDELRLEYFVLGARQQLVEQHRTFRVADRTAPDDFPATDAELMPPFPGLKDSENCRDWEPGVPVDLTRIRDVDEAYWDSYGGAPKAFVTLAAGDTMWKSGLGSATAIRFDASLADRVAAQLPRGVDPQRLGLVFRDVGTSARAGSGPATDFGGLFLGLSFFLIGAALILTSLLFAFRVEQRAPQIGILLASGYLPRQVQWLLLGEAAVLSVCGAVVGVPLGLWFTGAVLRALESVWSGALGTTNVVEYAPSGTSIVIAVASAVVVALLSVLGSMRRPFRVDIVSLLQSRAGLPLGDRAGVVARVPRTAVVLAIGGLVGAVGLVGAILAGGAAASSQAASGAFFGAGALLLTALIAASRLLVARFAGDPERPVRSVADLALRNTARRPGRSLAAVALLASGVFLVASVQSFRLDPPSDPTDRASGTGGFTLWARTVLPILRDLDTADGRSAYALDDAVLDGVRVVGLQLVEGDEASCLNLASPQTPRLLGVDATVLAERGSFTFASTADGVGDESPWTLLDRDLGPDVVPAVGDAASLQWTLHKGIGDRIEYVDDRGRPFAVEIVGAVQDSLVQGSLVVSRRHVEDRFAGSSDGVREFWIDAPTDRRDAVADELRTMLADFGPVLERADERLASFHRVQNTYLLIFRGLGALGLLLGSLGLGLIVLRNVLERRVELAVLGAVGYATGTVRRMLFVEHGLLLGLGLVGGVVAALIAIGPGLLARGSDPTGVATSLLGLVALLGASGLVWVCLATWAATASTTRGDGLTNAIRDE